MSTPRYTLANISTSDLKILELSKKVLALGYKHMEIYRRGLVSIEEMEIDKLKQNNNA